MGVGATSRSAKVFSAAIPVVTVRDQVATESRVCVNVCVCVFLILFCTILIKSDLTPLAGGETQRRV